jgi:hypothetical protein
MTGFPLVDERHHFVTISVSDRDESATVYQEAQTSGGTTANAEQPS